MLCSVKGCEMPSRSKGMCAPHYGRQWRQANAAQKKAADAAWRDANRDKLRADAGDYRKTPAKAAADRRWREANRESESKRRAAWDKTHPDRARERAHANRAKRRSAFVEKVDLDALWDHDRGFCQLCGERIDLTLPWPHPLSRSLDHITPLSRGGLHEQANAQLAHLVCNIRKGNRLQTNTTQTP